MFNQVVYYCLEESIEKLNIAGLGINLLIQKFGGMGWAICS